MAYQEKDRKAKRPRISITIDEEFLLPEEGELHPRFPMEPLEDEDDLDFQKFLGHLFPRDPGKSLRDMLRKGSPKKGKEFGEPLKPKRRKRKNDEQD